MVFMTPHPGQVGIVIEEEVVEEKIDRKLDKLKSTSNNLDAGMPKINLS